MNDPKNHNDQKQFMCLDERQVTWCCSIAVMLFAVVIIVAYVAGYRSAMRTTIDDTKKDSFADHIYTSLACMHTEKQVLQGYYVECIISEHKTAEELVDLMKKEGLALHALEQRNNAVGCQQTAKINHRLVSAVMDTQEEANAFAECLKNKTNMCDAAIITTQKAQKLKGFIYDYSVT